jgi:membrane-bound ClpP family serine protease
VHSYQTRLTSAVLATTLHFSGAALAQSALVTSIDEHVIRLEGEITIGTVLVFDRVLSDNREAVWVQLDSNGGSVYAALLIARKIRSSELSTRFRTHNQNMTVAASAIADRNTLGHRSYRVATRRQSLILPNMRSIRLRRL